LASVFPHGVPAAVDICDEDLEAEQATRGAAPAGPPDYVVIGCPHASLEQLAELTRLLDGKRVTKDTRFLVHTSQDVREAAGARGDLAVLDRAGVRVTADTCMYV